MPTSGSIHPKNNLRSITGASWCAPSKGRGDLQLTKAGRGFLVMWAVVSLLASDAALAQTRRNITQEHRAPVVAPAPVEQLAAAPARIVPRAASPAAEIAA